MIIKSFIALFMLALASIGVSFLLFPSHLIAIKSSFSQHLSSAYIALKGAYLDKDTLPKNHTPLTEGNNNININIKRNGTPGVGSYLPYGNFIPQKEIYVTDETALLKALKNAPPGSDIVLASGKYQIKERSIALGNHGIKEQPIRLRAEAVGSVVLELNSYEGFYINKAFWIFEDLIFKGMCATDSACEHAMHIVGDADNLIIQNNEFINFNSHIKSNGWVNHRTRTKAFPDSVTVNHNTFINEWRRDTGSAITPLDIIGGNDWLIKQNFIADFSKAAGNQISYAAFLKGGGENGVFEDNLVSCEWKVPHQSPNDVRVGLSFGGGGTGKQYCQTEECDVEHYNGKMLKNTIVNCPNDVGIYLNKALDSLLVENVVFNSVGIDVRFPETRVTATGNVLDGRLKTRNGAKILKDDTVVISIKEEKQL